LTKYGDLSEAEAEETEMVAVAIKTAKAAVTVMMAVMTVKVTAMTVKAAVALKMAAVRGTPLDSSSFLSLTLFYFYSLFSVLLCYILTGSISTDCDHYGHSHVM
jgi:hypothetical protein